MDLQIDPNTVCLTIHVSGRTWQTQPAKAELTVSRAGGDETFPLAAAKSKAIAPHRTGMGEGHRIELAGFGNGDIRLVLLAWLDQQNAELHVSLNAIEGQDRFVSLRWPGPMTPQDGQVSVIPMTEGALLPANWPNDLKYAHNLAGRPWYMPWWGQHVGKAGYLAIVDTVADAALEVDHPAGGPTGLGVRWDASLGRFGYARAMKYLFLDDAGFVRMAKAYRRHVTRQGRFVHLAQKIQRSPKLARLIGSPVIHTWILYHIQPDCQGYYRPDDPAANHRLTSFAVRADQLARLKRAGLESAYVHLDGWGSRGYDNLHPDVLPPCPEAGGWEGLRRLADACHECGYLLALHDQYRDYYHDAASFDLGHATRDGAGKPPFNSWWFGGKQSVLCASLAFEYVRRNHAALTDNGVRIDGAYLDVFASVAPDECFHPDHPMSRFQCMQHRIACLGHIRSTGGVVSTEEPLDWAVPHADLVHWGPYAAYPQQLERGPAIGVPVPLFQLVYHDSLIVPHMLDKDGWGAQEDNGTAWAALHGTMPYLDVEAGPEALARCRSVCELHRRVALQELLDHQIIGDGRRRRSIFKDGTAVEADLDSGRFGIAK